jgi:peptide/nickel transport system substrate-binding protein
MAKAAELAMKDSVRVWVVDQIVPYLYRKDVTLAADLSGGFSTGLWSRTVRFVDKVGGTFRAGNREVFVEPWNPVAGTNWVYDTVIISATQGAAFLTNPYTGLPMPERVINVTVFVEKDVSTTVSSDWLTLKFVDRVDVPADAWWGYDTKAKKIVTAGEAGVKAAKVRVIANYGDVIGKIKYHDGTTMSLADWVALWPLGFYRVDPDSPLYDAACDARLHRVEEPLHGLEDLEHFAARNRVVRELHAPRSRVHHHLLRRLAQHPVARDRHRN